MNSKNKYVKAMLSATLAVSSIPIVASTYAQETTFSDVPSSAYFYDAVHVLAERGIVTGYGDSTFRPNVAATRGQIAKILAGILGLDTNDVVDPGFTDVLPSNPYYGAIAALAQAGIINGYEDHTFRMNEPLQRNHLAKIFVKAFDLQAREGATMPLTDVHKDYKDYILPLYTNGITTGRTATQFDGTSNVTRGQLVVFVVRTEAVVQSTADEIEKPDIDPNPPTESQPKLVPAFNLTFTLSIEGMEGIFSTDKEMDLMTTAVIARMYVEGDGVIITFVSEEAIPKESFKVKIRNVEYEFKFNRDESKWVATKFKEAISPVPESRPDPSPPSAISVTGISLNTTTATISQGETAQLRALISPTNATNQHVTWISSDNNVATVDSQGKVTAIGVGNAIITATTADGAKTVTQAITVTAAPPIIVINIIVQTAPTKVAYNENETLDLTGLVVTLEKSNSTSENVGFADFASKGITVSPTNGTALTASDTVVTITANGKTVTQAITVTP